MSSPKMRSSDYGPERTAQKQVLIRTIGARNVQQDICVSSGRTLEHRDHPTRQRLTGSGHSSAWAINCPSVSCLEYIKMGIYMIREKTRM